MGRTWIYIFYCTWRLQNLIVTLFIEDPLLYIANRIPFLKKNWEKNKTEYYNIKNSKDFNSNLLPARSFMLIATIIILASVCRFVVQVLDLEVENYMKYIFCAVFIITFVINYPLNKEKNIKKYFKENRKVKSNIIYITAFVFHFFVWSLGLFYLLLT